MTKIKYRSQIARKEAAAKAALNPDHADYLVHPEAPDHPPPGDKDIKLFPLSLKQMKNNPWCLILVGFSSGSNICE
jgi:hypothetical protein